MDERGWVVSLIMEYLSDWEKMGRKRKESKGVCRYGAGSLLIISKRSPVRDEIPSMWS